MLFQMLLCYSSAMRAEAVERDREELAQLETLVRAL
jgi:hypothetical protein